jgi:hypothetical protein
MLLASGLQWKRARQEGPIQARPNPMRGLFPDGRQSGIHGRGVKPGQFLYPLSNTQETFQ